MTEPISNGEGNSKFKLPEGNRPFLEEAAEIGAQRVSERTGKPVAVVLDEAEKKAEQEESTFWQNLYRKVKNRLTGN